MRKMEMNSYYSFLSDLKRKIRSVQIKVARSINKDSINLYWYIGKGIVERQKKLGWGKSVIENLSKDLRTEFPEQTGFSAQSLWFMRQFYNELKGKSNLLQLARDLPWWHIVTIITKVKNDYEREYYFLASARYGWTRSILTHHIETKLFLREVKQKKTHNFKQLLPPEQANDISQILNEPYIFDFIALEPDAKEQQLERELLRHLKQFLIELGSGFSFVGSQYRILIGNEEFFIDLLFYHLKLRRYIVIELKTVAFKPEFAGKMNFYLSAVDEKLRHKDDLLSIGILLCKDKNDIIVEFALRDVFKPMGVARYKVTNKLPKQFAKSLPSAEELRKQLQGVEE